MNPTYHCLRGLSRSSLALHFENSEFANSEGSDEAAQYERTLLDSHSLPTNFRILNVILML